MKIWTHYKRIFVYFILTGIFVLQQCNPFSVSDENEESNNLAALFMIAQAQRTSKPTDPDIKVQSIPVGLESPWGLEFLPNQEDILITSRTGNKLYKVNILNQTKEELTIPFDSPTVGQGGLLDVTIHPNFAQSENWIYFTHTTKHPSSDTYSTRLTRCRYTEESHSLSGCSPIFTAEPYMEGGAHFGSRLVFGADGKIYMTTGDRGDYGANRDTNHVSQRLDSTLGKVIRLEDDGSIPSDNPDLTGMLSGALPGIYTFGHRNAQGIALEKKTGKLWASEHGERHGDEINLIDRPAGNYGWPIASYSVRYDNGEQVGVPHNENQNTVLPKYYWNGSTIGRTGGFSPAGMSFYSGKEFPEWEGNLLIGNLSGKLLGRFTISNDTVTDEFEHLAAQNWRIRDAIISGKTGKIYIIYDGSGVPLVELNKKTK